MWILQRKYLEIYKFLKIYSLGPGDAIFWHRSGSTLAQVMACCLMAPSYYLNQCWLFISEVNFTKIPQPLITNISLKITWIKFYSSLPGANELISWVLLSLSCYCFVIWFHFGYIITMTKAKHWPDIGLIKPLALLWQWWAVCVKFTMPYDLL